MGPQRTEGSLGPFWDREDWKPLVLGELHRERRDPSERQMHRCMRFLQLLESEACEVRRQQLVGEDWKMVLFRKRTHRN